MTSFLLPVRVCVALRPVFLARAACVLREVHVPA